MAPTFPPPMPPQGRLNGSIWAVIVSVLLLLVVIAVIAMYVS